MQFSQNNLKYNNILFVAPGSIFNDLLQHIDNIYFKENSLKLNLIIPLISIIKLEMYSQ